MLVRMSQGPKSTYLRAEAPENMPERSAPVTFHFLMPRASVRLVSSANKEAKVVTRLVSHLSRASSVAREVQPWNMADMATDRLDWSSSLVLATSQNSSWARSSSPKRASPRKRPVKSLTAVVDHLVRPVTWSSFSSRANMLARDSALWTFMPDPSKEVSSS